MTRKEAASLCALSLSGFSRWVAEGIVPGPLPGTQRWDREAITAALNCLSGLASKSEQLSPLEEWRAKRGRR
jgi:hypothetical protein